MDPNAKVILKVMNLGCCDSCPKKVVKALRKLGIEDIQLEIDQGGTGTLTIGHTMVPPTRMVKEISKHVSKKTVIVPPPPPPPAPAPAPSPALTPTPTPAPSPTPTPFFTPSSSFNDSMASAWFCASAAGHCPAANEPLPAPLAPQHVPHSSSSSSSSSGGGGGWTYSAGHHHPSPHYASPQASYYPSPSLPPSRDQYYDNNFNLHYYRDENADGPGGCNFW